VRCLAAADWDWIGEARHPILPIFICLGATEMGRLRQRLRADLDAAESERAFGTGWISGVLALACALFGLGAVLFLMFPSLFSMPMLREHYGDPWFRFGLHLVLISAFVLAMLNLVLRRQRIMGFTAISAVLIATLLGGSRTQSHDVMTTDYYLGLDWFLINLTLLGALFIPLERLFARRPEQPIFRLAWREDLFYFLVNSLLVQSLTYLSLTPATQLAAHTDWGTLRTFMASQPLWLQFLQIVVVTDLTQYWVHRIFHRVPALWRFHAVHHSAQKMDWLAGSRMHVVEIVFLRGITIIPMYALGFHEWALKAYILYIYLHSTFIHANVRFEFGWLKHILATPQFHHWHHGIEKGSDRRQFCRDLSLAGPLVRHSLPAGEMAQRVWRWWPPSAGRLPQAACLSVSARLGRSSSRYSGGRLMFPICQGAG
jgi:sterol desaturase/sphingolipid hydroxylase (fatty acid hydroxylase superfamily)